MRLQMTFIRIVTDEAGNPIENIRVIIRNAWDNTPNPYADDTVFTDKEGAFANEMTGTVGIDKQKVYFDDVDGEDNGGLFQSDSTNIADMEATLVEEGHGSWYQGKYEFEVHIKIEISFHFVILNGVKDLEYTS